MNNDFLGHSWCDLPMIFTRDFVTRENHWQIASLVTQKSLFTVTHLYHCLRCLTCMHLGLNSMYCVKETYAVYHTKNCNIKSNDIEGVDRFDLDICIYIYIIYLAYRRQHQFVTWVNVFSPVRPPKPMSIKYYPEFKAIQYEICSCVFLKRWIFLSRLKNSRSKSTYSK